MYIFVTTYTNKIIPVEVELTDTIREVKAKIQAKEGYPINQQYLKYHGQQLGDDRTLIYCSIFNKSTLQLAFRIKGSNFKYDFRKLFTPARSELDD